MRKKANKLRWAGIRVEDLGVFIKNFKHLNVHISLGTVFEVNKVFLRYYDKNKRALGITYSSGKTYYLSWKEIKGKVQIKTKKNGRICK